MKVIFLQVFLLLVFSINAQTLQWANQRQVYHETKIHLDDDGNVFMIGEFIGTVDFGHSTSTFMMTATSQYGSVFLLKQSPDGDFLWAKQIESVSGNVTWSQGYNINTDNDGNVYITGRYGGTVDFDMGSNVSMLTAVDDADAFLAKYDNDGNYQWVINVGGIDYEYGKDIVFSESESALYLTGTFKTTVDFDPGPGIANLTSNGLNDIFIAKYDLDGNYIWALSAGGTDGDDPEAIAVDNQGNVAITGFFRNTVDFDPGPGVYELTALLGLETYTAMYDKDGNFLWANPVLEGGGDRGHSLEFDNNGNLFVVGTFWGTADFDPSPAFDWITSTDNSTDFFMIKYSNSGDYLWAQNIGGINGDLVSEIGIDSDDNIFLTGRYLGTTDFDPSDNTAIFITAGGDTQAFFLASYDNDGAYLWTMVLGDVDNNSRGFSIALDGLGNIYLSGRYLNSFDFDPSPDSLILETGDIDRSFLAKYSYPICLNSYSSTEETICTGETIAFDGQDLDSTGIYQYSIPNQIGCDSIISLILTVLPEINIYLNAEICEGDNIIFEDEVLTMEGEYVVNYQTANGCDSTITLYLEVWEGYDIQLDTAFCLGDSIEFENQNITTAGVFSANYIDVNGCDSIITMTTSVYDLPIVDLGEDIEILTLDTFEFSLMGSYTSILWSDGSTAPNFIFNGADYTPGDYTITVIVTNENGCVGYDEVNISLSLGIHTSEPEWAKTVEIIPNPTDGFIQISATGLINAKVQIKNNLGESIGGSAFNSSMSYDFSNETPGVYFIIIESNEQWIVRKIIVL